MDLSKRQLLTAQQALGYAVMYAKTESETAEFALLKFDIDCMLIRQEAADKPMLADVNPLKDFLLGLRFAEHPEIRKEAQRLLGIYFS